MSKPNNMFVPPPGRKVLRRMGFFSDQKGLLNRYFREAEEWKEHLENSSEFIISCLRNKKVKEIIVLGSGWLLDFPLSRLVHEIESIKLVDILHPPQILKKIRNFSGVECVSADITGGYAERLYKETLRVKKFKTPFIFESGAIYPELERKESTFVISLNILNQIDAFIVDHMKERIPVDEKTVFEIRRKIQSDHINMLTAGRYILITDYEEIIINSKDQDKTIKNLLSVELPVCQHVKEWKWMFDSQDTYNRGGQTILKIRAMCSESPVIQ